MASIPERPDRQQEWLELLKEVLARPEIRGRPEFVDAVADGDHIAVTLQPEGVNHPVALNLRVVSAAIISRMPRFPRTRTTVRKTSTPVIRDQALPK